MRWRQGRVLAVAAGVMAAGCSHVRERMAVAVAADDGPVVCTPDAQCHDHAKVCKHPTVHALACDLDHLEKHIECYGSVVAKVPDVWGQARLTQHREDFERQMKDDLTTFEAGLQGNYARSDQSYLAFALSLGLAAQPKPPVIGSLSVGDKSGTTVPPAPVLKSVETVTTDKSVEGKEVKTTESRGLPDKEPPPTGPDPIKPESPGDPTKMVGKDAVPFARSDKVEVKRYEYLGGKDAVVGIEPAERLAQKKRYLDLLAQYRRENEGGDTADAPGYQLNLMRLPVSVLPGSHTDRGHGAEVTFTIDPILGDDLLPTTFRRMVVNDLTHQLGFPLAKFLEEEFRAKPENRNLTEDIQLFLQDVEARQIARRNGVKEEVIQTRDQQAVRLNKQYKTQSGKTMLVQDGFIFLRKDESNPELELKYKKWNESIKPILAGATTDRKQRLDDLWEKIGEAAGDAMSPAYLDDLSKALPAPTAVSDRVNDARRRVEDKKAPGVPLDKRRDQAEAEIRTGVQAHIVRPQVSFSNALAGRYPYPSAEVIDVLGIRFTFEIGYAAQVALQQDIQRNKYAHVPDLESYLREELQSAAVFLAHPANQHLWGQFCTSEVAGLVKSKRWDDLLERRRQFRDQMMVLTGSKALYREEKDDKGLSRLYVNNPGDTRQTGRIAAFSWAILVNSALLNDKLVRDMRESATAKGLAPPCPADAWPQFFLPEPPPDARQLFACYVKQRWPIYVFALDPMVQEQNIAESLSTRRETQLALAAGFTNGAISAKTFLNAARRLEAEYQTIALTRTQVGFAHGENTFGWRFYPRFQTMPTQTNFTVLFRDQIIGGPTNNAILRQRRLEPGPRECVALVIMPSFVPYVTVDATSNWFRLADPKCKLFDHTQALKLSKTVRTLETCGQTVTDAACYRDNELHRLQTRVKQLADRLPAQTLTVPVPIVNTLGGFEMFSNGTTDLAPELYGWYGAPGVSADDKDTTLFLVGDHFSPLQTRVIVGNTEIAKDVPAGQQPAVRMLSRQVMQVTVPKTKAVPVVTPDGKFVQAHVATPYGVSRELLIPYLSEKPADKPKLAEGYAVPDGTKLSLRYHMKAIDPARTHFDPVLQGVDTRELKFVWEDALGVAPKAVDVQVRFPFGAATVLTVPCRCSVRATTVGGARREVVLDNPELTRLACDLLRQLAGRPELTAAGNPLNAGLAGEVYVTPVVSDKQTAGVVKAVGKLAVEFKSVGPCADAPPCPCDVCVPPVKP